MYFLNEKLDELSKDQKIYFVFACVERIVQVFEYNYDETIRTPRETVNSIIQMLVQKDIDIKSIEKAKKQIEKEVPNIDKMGSEFQPSMTAGVSILYAIDSILISEKENIVRSLEYALEAVDSFSEFNGDGYEEEKKWQIKIFEIIKKYNYYPAEIIAEMNKKPPDWSANWRD